ncbi:MAG: gliding motility-associated C-terminal domain-containing protein [Bacteroidota bacterium]
MKKTYLIACIVFLMMSIFITRTHAQTFSLTNIPQHSAAFTISANCTVAITSSGGGSQQWQGTSIGTNGLGGGGGSVAQNCNNQTGLRLEMTGAGNSTGTAAWNNSITVTFTFPQGVKGPATFNLFDFTEPFYNDGSFNYAYYQDKATISATKCDGTAITPTLTTNNGPITTSTTGTSLILAANKLQGQCLNEPISVGTATDLIKTITVIYSNQDPPTNVPTPVGNPARYGISQYQYIFISNIIAFPTDTITVTATPNPICVGQTVTLTASSPSPYTYSWSPATTPATGSPVTATPSTTTVYTVTGTNGTCTKTNSITVNVTSGLTPTFAPLGPYCVGATAASLPLTSTNGISGTWNPSVISTATAGISIYTFTPTSSLCASSTTMSITVSSGISPTFTALGPYCIGATPALLPPTSTNSITGNWNPSTISTATIGTTVYTFTPNAGQCAIPATMSVNITSSITPAFAALGPYCIGSTAPALPVTSTNSIAGSWSPATINTAALGTTVYTFTPNAGQCAVTATMNIDITSSIIPVFTTLGPYCVGSTPDILPASSTNGINGVWNPAVINTSSLGTTIYTFTPNAGQCAATTTMTVVVTTSILPTFPTIGPFCVGLTPTDLPLTSTNGITGTWNPMLISTIMPGNSDYTFTPNSGQCATAATITITIDPTPAVTALASPDTICNGQSTALTGYGADTYSWMPGNLNGTTVNVSPSSNTVYTVTGTTINGCTNVSTVSVTISSSATLSFTSTPHEGCIPLAVQFNFVNNGNFDPNSLHWDFGDPTTTTDVSSLNSPTYTYTNSGSFIVSLSATEIAGCTAVGYDTIHVLPNPLADFTANPWFTDVYTPTIHFYDASVNANEWLWDFGDVSNNTSTEQFPLHYYANPGDYAVMLIIHNGACVDTVIKHVTIGDGFTYYIPNTFSPNEDNKNEVFNGKGYGYKTDEFELCIFDRWGELIFETKDSEKGWDGTYKGTLCPQGVYVYKFKVVELNNKGHIYAGSVILIK